MLSTDDLEANKHSAPSDCVFIHGAGGNSLLWNRTLRYLSGAGSAVAINLPGHPSGEIVCRTIGEYSDFIHKYISDNMSTPTVVCGHSMGSAIALQLAIDHEDSVRGLILVGGGAKLGVSPSIIEGLSSMPLRAIEELITPMSFHSITLQSGREARTALSLSNLPVFLNDYQACDRFDVRDRLPSINTRTLVVCGEGDKLTPPKYSHYLNGNIPDSQAYFVRGAGHMVPLEKPESLAGLLQPFLEELSR